VPLPYFQPLPLSRARAPFSHPDWLFEIKWDGFRALLYSDNNGVRLVSRNGNTFKSVPLLGEGLARDLKGRRCVLDGEIVCLDADGKPQFSNLLFRRADLLSMRSTFFGTNTHPLMMKRKAADFETEKTFGICR
jgi:ATP-dependent DNA ligase